MIKWKERLSRVVIKAPKEKKDILRKINLFVAVRKMISQIGERH